MSSSDERLGKNIDRYAGETINLTAVLDKSIDTARSHGWATEIIPASPKPNLLAFTRSSAHSSPRTLRLYIPTGIHGDEPAGPLAVCRLVEENLWPTNVSIWLCPCLNPTGFILNQRENDEGTDLN